MSWHIYKSFYIRGGNHPKWVILWLAMNGHERFRWFIPQLWVRHVFFQQHFLDVSSYKLYNIDVKNPLFVDHVPRESWVFHGFSMCFPHQSLPQWPVGSLWKLSRFGRLWPLRAILCREAKSKRQALEYGGNSFLLRQQPDIYNMLYHFISFYMNHLEALELVECHSERQSDKTSLPCWFVPAKICHGISGLKTIRLLLDLKIPLFGVLLANNNYRAM